MADALSPGVMQMLRFAPANGGRLQIQLEDGLVLITRSRDAQGRQQTTVDIVADGLSCGPRPDAWIDGAQGDTSRTVRIVST